jgi:hypothetical protein
VRGCELCPFRAVPCAIRDKRLPDIPQPLFRNRRA